MIYNDAKRFAFGTSCLLKGTQCKVSNKSNKINESNKIKDNHSAIEYRFLLYYKMTNEPPDDK